ncbi:4Fe-4S dicluster domain-containing protein [bacterium]|nr:4Fe-4S dicluster domain-containing protein [candidate division CSSED10-310 bacterium]
MKIINPYEHSITIDEELCVGCVICTLACPAKAIRVKDEKAKLIKSGLCIDCGECLRVCPQNAVKAMTSRESEMQGFTVLAALPSPVLYSQFGEMYSPNDILLALKKIGFDYVYDVAVSVEEVFIALNEYLNRKKNVRPLISNFCPAVARLIIKNYPDLIEHIVQIEVPRELSARAIRKKIAEEQNLEFDDIGVFHITPCAAKMISITNPVGSERSNLDGAIAIRDIYLSLINALKEDGDDEILQRSSGVGISWAKGSASKLGLPNRRTLSINGIKDVVKVLDDVESGKLRDIDYIECSICPGGCVGGPLVIQNKHIAARRVETLIEQYGSKSRLNTEQILKRFEMDFLLTKNLWEAQAPDPLDTDLSRALEMMNKIEEILEILPGKQCGACGAPTCHSLAEDIVKGEAKLNDCVFIRNKELENALKRNN